MCLCGMLSAGAFAEGKYTRETKVQDVINVPVFEDYGRLIFPVDMQISNDLKLKDVEDILPWYSEVNPEKTVEIANYMRDQCAAFHLPWLVICFI